MQDIFCTIYELQDNDIVEPENIKELHQMNLLRSFSFESFILEVCLQKLILLLNQAEVLNKN